MNEEQELIQLNNTINSYLEQSYTITEALQLALQEERNDMAEEQEIRRSCRNCKYYNYGYGYGGGKHYPDGYIACDFNKKVEKECKHSNFSEWRPRND